MRTFSLILLISSGICSLLKARVVYVITSISIFILIMLTSLSFLEPKSSFVSFGGAPTISIFNGKLTFIIGNDNEGSEKVLHVYALYNNKNNNINLSTTDLIDTISGQIIRSESIGFPNNRSAEIKNITETSPQNIKVLVNYGNNPAGVYQGSITATGENKTSIPFTFDLRPNLGQIIILVFDGIAISILAWKFIIYHNHKETNSRILKKKNELVTPGNPNPTLAGVMNALNTNLRPVSFQHYLKNKPTYDLEPLTLKKYVDYTATKEKAKNEGIQIVGTILFGIGVSMLGLFNNNYISGLHNVTYLDIFALIGIGLGIGSLKDFAAQLNRQENNS